MTTTLEPTRPANPDPTRLFPLCLGFAASKAALSAVELGVFTLLGETALTADQLADALGLHPRAVPDFPDALTALGLLERDGDGPDARYRNTPESAAFLDRSRATYIGGVFEMANSRLYRFWADLTEGLRTGRPQNEVKHTGASMFDELYREPARLEEFLTFMAGSSMANLSALADTVDFSRYHTLCDARGASGQLSLTLADRYPHLHCISVDLPPVQPIAQRTIATAGLSDRVTAVAGNPLTDPLPHADVVTMNYVLHEQSLENKHRLLRAGHEALREGGALIVIDNLIDDDRRGNAFPLLMSLNMLIEFGDAFDYTAADLTGWCTETGFRDVDVLPLAGPASAVIAHK